MKNLQMIIQYNFTNKYNKNTQINFERNKKNNDTLRFDLFMLAWNSSCFKSYTEYLIFNIFLLINLIHEFSISNPIPDIQPQQFSLIFGDSSLIHQFQPLSNYFLYHQKDIENTLQPKVWDRKLPITPHLSPTRKKYSHKISVSNDRVNFCGPPLPNFHNFPAVAAATTHYRLFSFQGSLVHTFQLVVSIQLYINLVI